LIAVMADNAAHSIVKSRSFHNRVRLIEQLVIQDVALASNGLGSDQIISSNHSDSDASLVALSNGNWDFGPDDVFDTNDTDESEASLLNIVEIISVTNIVVIRATLIRLEVSISERNSSERLTCIGRNNVEESLLHIIIERSLLSVLVQVVSARLENNFSSSLHVNTLVMTVLSLTAVVNN